MFRLAALALALTLLPAIAMIWANQRDLGLLWLQAALGPAAIVVPVLIQWVLHRRAAKDTVHGGWLEVEEVGWGVRWTNWGVIFTHAGELDEQAELLYVKSSLLFGLAPYGWWKRPLSDFYRVAVETRLIETPRDRYGGRSIGGDRYSYTLCAVDRRAREHTLIDFAEMQESGRGSEMVALLRSRLEAALGIGGGNPLARTKSGRYTPLAIAAEPPSPAAAEPTLGDAAPAGPAMVCPNCSRRYPATESRCSSCHVVLYRD